MSRTTKRWRLEMISGVLTAVGLICAIVWVWLVVAALAIAFSETAYPRLVGWICLAAAGIIALVTVDKWVKVLPVFLGMSILNALLAVVMVTSEPALPARFRESMRLEYCYA